jgi:hypothetical protein
MNRFLLAWPVFLLSVFLLSGVCAGTKASAPPASFRPVIVFKGVHQLTKPTFALINSSDQATTLFANALSATDYLNFPEIDYSEYTAICIFVPQKPLLRSLGVSHVKKTAGCIHVYFRENYPSQVFVGVNDGLASAPYTCVLIPKWLREVRVYREGEDNGHPPAWLLQATLR